MSTATSRELIEQAIAATNRRALALVEQARQRRERERLQRAELAAARSRGVARRHAARLRQQADRRQDPPDTSALTSQVPTCARERGADDGRTAD